MTGAAYGRGGGTSRPGQQTHVEIRGETVAAPEPGGGTLLNGAAGPDSTDTVPSAPTDLVTRVKLDRTPTAST
jgi:hypothetical protein